MVRRERKDQAWFPLPVVDEQLPGNLKSLLGYGTGSLVKRILHPRNTGTLIMAATDVLKGDSMRMLTSSVLNGP